MKHKLSKGNMSVNINNFSSDDLAFLKNKYEQVCGLTKREHEEDFTRDGRTINEFQRDYARCLYSSSFRRLQGKMQLLSIHGSKFYRNRLTHSLEVATIAREIASQLYILSSQLYSKDDVYVVEVGSLMHDIGNPPFGHCGEAVLNNLATSYGGYEGNAQALRTVRLLEKSHPEFRGLNLTKRSLLALVKYFKKDGKKFLYSPDYEFIEKLSDSGVTLRSLDAQIMDLADEIAYAAHDLEDAISEGFITIDALLYEFEQATIESRSDAWERAYEALKTIVDQCRRHASKAKIFKDSEEYDFILKKRLTSRIANTLINDLGVVKLHQDDKCKLGTMEDQELSYKSLQKLTQGLKKFTYKCIQRSDKVAVYEINGETVLQRLFKFYSDESHSEIFLPPEYRYSNPEIDKMTSRNRNVIDYLAGMMDSFAIEQYIRIFGKKDLLDMK